jgi:hypothetical protein
VQVTPRQVFDHLDWLNRGFLTSTEFRRYFDANKQVSEGTVLTAKDKENHTEMEALLRRFNKDKLSGRVSLPEFLELLTPKDQEKRY